MKSLNFGKIRQTDPQMKVPEPVLAQPAPDAAPVPVPATRPATVPPASA